MTIHYSPYFNGRTFIDYSVHGGGLFDETVERTAGLLSRLELLLGISWPTETDETGRAAAYFEVLDKAIGSDAFFSESFGIDREEEKLESDARHYRVSTELLAWRDTLILAGWDGLAELPARLALLSRAEKEIPADSIIHSGLADRWKSLSACIPGLKDSVQVILHCPEIMIPNAVMKAISPLLGKADETGMASSTGDMSRCRILKFGEQTDAYEWLATQTPSADTLVVCRDGSRLDSVLRGMGASVAAGRTQADAHHVVDDIRCMLDAPKNLVWLDCSGDLGFRYPYHFLSGEETEYLNSLSGISIPEQEPMLTSVHSHVNRCLASVPGQVTLVSADADLGQTLVEHPVIAALLHRKDQEQRLMPETPELDIPLQEEKEAISFSRTSEFELERNAAIRERHMSYSSLDQLVQHPFNYAVEKFCRMREEGEPDLQTEEGNVAHALVQLMVEAGGLTLSGFDTFLEKAIQQEGNYLKQEEYRFEREDFSFILKKSIASLRQIIESQDLEIVASEKEIEGELPVFGKCVAKIDLLLRDRRDKDAYVIFDFKYSRSDYNPRKLEENKSVQFAFYKEIFDTCSGMGKAVAMGYYLLPLGKLFVPEGRLGSDRLAGEGIQTVPLSPTALSDPLELLRRSYRYRMEQLGRGIIEEGEGLPMAGLAYNGEDAESRFPLEPAWDDKESKSGSYGNPHIVLKNQIR